MTEEEIIAMLDQWDRLEGAIDCVLESQQSSMTEAAAQLDKERLLMARMMHLVIQRSAKAFR